MKIPFNRPSIVGDELRHVINAINSGHLAGDGQYTALCSNRLCELTGSKSVLLTHSCTGALEMASILCNLSQGDEVIMPSYTFVSTANAVVLRGAIPVFVDIDPETLNINPIEVAKAVSPRTKAIFAVHYAGFPADMDMLASIAKDNELLLVEDAAQALGSRYKGRLVGSLGDLAAFSFHETKNIMSGEGGAIAVNRENLISRAEIIREKGTNRKAFLNGNVDKYSWVDIGSSFLPGELTAAFLYGQLEKSGEITRSRLAIYSHYMEAFKNLEAQERAMRPRASCDSTGNGHCFYLILRSAEERTALISHLATAKIQAAFHYVPLHNAPAARKFSKTIGTLPITEDIAARIVRLPIFNDIGADIEMVISETLRFFR